MTDRVKFGPGRRKELADFLAFDLRRVLDARQDMESNWRSWLEQYRAPAPTDVKRFPYEGASDYTFPITHMSVDPVRAKYMSSLHATPNLWTLQPLNERWIEIAKPLQDHLTWVDKRIIRMFDVNSRVVNEMLKLGTGIYKTGWEFKQHKTRGYDSAGNQRQFIRRINRPTVDHVLNDNFVIPPEAISEDPEHQGGAMWVAERMRLRPSQLKQLSRAQEPFLPQFDPEGVNHVMRFVEMQHTEYKEKAAELDDLDLNRMIDPPVEIWEVHIRWDADGDGFDEDLVITYHRESLTILRAIYNPAAHGSRPYSIVRFLRGDGFYGIGLAERAAMWQHLISDVLNFNIDKIVLSNTPMFAIKEGANVLPNEPIFPGKFWPLQDPKNDIVPLFMTAPGSFDINTLIAFAQNNAERAVGVTDLQQGSISGVPSRTPATTVQSLLQESATRLDMSIKEARLGGLSEVGLRILQNIQQQSGNVVNNPGSEDFIRLAVMTLGQPEGTHVSNALQLPFEDISLGLGVELTATSGTSNRELERQSALALLQIIGQWGPQLIQLAQVAQQAAGTPLAQVALDTFSGGRQLLLRLLEQFDVRNPEEIVPGDVSALMQAQMAGEGQQAPVLPNGAGGQQPQGLTQF